MLGFNSATQIVNIENRRIYDDTLGLSGSIDAGFSFTRNQNTLLSTSFRPKIQFKSRNHYLLFLTDWYYSKGTSTTYSNFGMAHLRYGYRLGKKSTNKKSPWKWESYAQLQYNQLLDQKSRLQLGSGLRLKALDKVGFRIFAGTSLMYDYEEIRTTLITINTIRTNTYLSWYLNKNKSYAFTGVTYYQPSIENLNDFQFSGQYTFSFQLFKHVDLNLEANIFYDSKPNLGVVNWLFYSSMGTRIRLSQ